MRPRCRSWNARSATAIHRWQRPPSARSQGSDRPNRKTQKDTRFLCVLVSFGSLLKLPRSFYDRYTLDVARDLLGKVLVHERRGVRTSGVIVEVEAYIGEADPACHAAPGPTPRDAPMY